MNHKLNDQALHFEIMIQKLRPDLMNKHMRDPMGGAIVREDIRRFESDEHKLAKDILVEQGVLGSSAKSGLSTVLLDQFHGKNGDDGSDLKHR